MKRKEYTEAHNQLVHGYRVLRRAVQWADILISDNVDCEIEEQRQEMIRRLEAHDLVLKGLWTMVEEMRGRLKKIEKED
jgi:hypothetical protein